MMSGNRTSSRTGDVRASGDGDGNVLAGVEHRIEPLRTTWAAGLPGMSLAVYEPGVSIGGALLLGALITLGVATVGGAFAQRAGLVAPSGPPAG